MKFTPAARLAGIEKSVIRQIFDRAPLDAINLGLGEPDFPTPGAIRAAAQRFIHTGKIRYTPNAGLLELRRAIAADYGDAARFEGVCVTNGSQEALFVALMGLINPGDDVLLPDSGFVAYPALVRMAGGKPVFYKLPARHGFAFDAEEFRQRLTANTRAVIINSPSNPTGRMLTPENLKALANALQGSSALVIADEVYRELYFDVRPAAIGDFYPHTVVISGLSKSHAMTGWRLGWIYGDPEIVRHLIVLHQYATTCASAISQRAALAAFTEEGRAALAELRQDLRARRDFLVELLDTQFADLNLDRIIPDGAFYLMLAISRFGASLEVAERMLQNKVITIPGAAFGEEAEGYLRLSFATDFDTIRAGVRRVKAALVA